MPRFNRCFLITLIAFAWLCCQAPCYAQYPANSLAEYENLYNRKNNITSSPPGSSANGLFNFNLGSLLGTLSQFPLTQGLSLPSFNLSLIDAQLFTTALKTVAPSLNGSTLTPLDAMQTLYASARTTALKMNSPIPVAEQAKVAQLSQAISLGNAAGDLNKEQAVSAINNLKGALKNFTVNPSSIWVKLHDRLFIPIAILLLLPGAVISQARAVAAAGNSAITDTGTLSSGAIHPFDGILRAIVAVFLIASNSLVINYGIDVSNAIGATLAIQYKAVSGEDMYEKAVQAQLKAFPVRQEPENAGAGIQPSSWVTTPTKSVSSFENNFISVNKTVDPITGATTTDPSRVDEAMPIAAAGARLLSFGANSALLTAWNVLSAFQFAFLVYLYLMGPIAAAMWVYPFAQLRSAFGSWVDGVLTLCFWTLFWNTSVMLMAAFVDNQGTGTTMMTALNFLTVSSVKFSFDFTGLVKAAASQAGQKATEALQGKDQGKQDSQGNQADPAKQGKDAGKDTDASKLANKTDANDPANALSNLGNDLLNGTSLGDQLNTANGGLFGDKSLNNNVLGDLFNSSDLGKIGSLNPSSSSPFGDLMKSSDPLSTLGTLSSPSQSDALGKLITAGSSVFPLGDPTDGKFLLHTPAANSSSNFASGNDLTAGKDAYHLLDTSGKQGSLLQQLSEKYPVGSTEFGALSLKNGLPVFENGMPVLPPANSLQSGSNPLAADSSTPSPFAKANSLDSSSSSSPLASSFAVSPSSSTNPLGNQGSDLLTNRLNDSNNSNPANDLRNVPLSNLSGDGKNLSDSKADNLASVLPPNTLTGDNSFGATASAGNSKLTDSIAVTNGSVIKGTDSVIGNLDNAGLKTIAAAADLSSKGPGAIEPVGQQFANQGTQTTAYNPVSPDRVPGTIDPVGQQFANQGTQTAAYNAVSPDRGPGAIEPVGQQFANYSQPAPRTNYSNDSISSMPAETSGFASSSSVSTSISAGALAGAGIKNLTDKLAQSTGSNLGPSSRPSLLSSALRGANTSLTRHSNWTPPPAISRPAAEVSSVETSPSEQSLQASPAASRSQSVAPKERAVSGTQSARDKKLRELLEEYGNNYA